MVLWKHDARDAVLGLLLALALFSLLVALDVRTSENGPSDGRVLLRASLVALLGLGLVALWRRGQPRVLLVACVVFAALVPLLVQTPWLWLLAGAAAVAWLAAPAPPVLRLSGTLLFWPLAAVAAYSVDLGEANLWLTALAVGASCLLLWWTLPQEGMWRTIPFVALLVPLVAAAGIGVVLSVIEPSWQRALLAVGGAALAAGVWHLRHHPAWRPEAPPASAQREPAAPVP